MPAPEWLPWGLALGAALAWAGLDAARKRLSQRLPPVPLVIGLSSLGLPLIAAWLAWEGMPTVGWAALWPALATVALNSAANLLFVRSLALAPISRSVPMLALTPALTALSGWLLLDERPGPGQVGALLAVVLGTLAMVWPDPAADRTEARSARRGVLWMGVVATLWAVASPLDKLLSERSNVPFAAAVQSAGVCLVMLLWLVGRGQLRQLRGLRAERVWLVRAGLLLVLALGLQLSAFSLLHVSQVDTLKRAVGVLAAQGAGLWFFRERVGARQWSGVGLVVLGVVGLFLSG